MARHQMRFQYSHLARRSIRTVRAGYCKASGSARQAYLPPLYLPLYLVRILRAEGYCAARYSLLSLRPVRYCSCLSTLTPIASLASSVADPGRSAASGRMILAWKTTKTWFAIGLLLIFVSSVPHGTPVMVRLERCSERCCRFIDAMLVTKVASGGSDCDMAQYVLLYYASLLALSVASISACAADRIRGHVSRVALRRSSWRAWLSV